MKKILTVVLYLVAFVLLSGSSIIEDRAHPVLINGKPFANTVTINGNLYVSLQDFAKAFGGTLSLEQAGFKLQGTTLTAVGSPSAMQHKHKVLEASTAPDTFSATAHKEVAQKVRFSEFHIVKQADVSTAILMKEGKAYVPLADVVKAFGGGVYSPNQANLKPGESINLSFTVNANSILSQ